jgi:sugar phosphate isomerase/epimerase
MAMPQPRVIFSTGSLYPLDVARSFELAAEAGFDGIEIMCDERYSSRDPSYLKNLSERSGLPIAVVHTPFSFQLMGWRGAGNDQIERIRRTLELAESLNAGAIVVHLPRYLGYGTLNFGRRRVVFPWTNPTYPVKAWIEDELPRLQSQTSIKIAIENMPLWKLYGFKVDFTYWNEVQTWSRVHDWLTLDTTHWATKGIDPIEAYNAANGRVCHIHLSNFENGNEHRLPHQGELDLGAFLRRLVETGFSGTICTELAPDALEFYDTSLLRQNLRDSLAFCREHLEQST